MYFKFFQDCEGLKGEICPDSVARAGNLHGESREEYKIINLGFWETTHLPLP